MATRDTSDQGQPNRMGSEPVGRAQDEAQNLGRQAAQSGRDALEAGREKMNEQVGVAQHRIRSLLEQQTHRAADQLGGVAQALHAAARQLNDENNGTAAARYADQAAQRIDDIADMLRHSTVDDMVARVEGFARRQPEVFIGGAFALGFLFARFIKSSGDRQRHGQMMARQRAAGTATSYDFSQEHSTIGGSYPAGARSTGGAGAGVARGRARATPSPTSGTAGGSGAGGASGIGGTSGTGGTSGPGATGMGATGMGGVGAGGSAGAASATTATGTRDAAELMAGGSPEPIRTGTGTSAGKPDTAHPGVTKAVNVPDETLTSTPATGGKPQETMP
ncbi:MAG TPA: hypothetical protein VD995_01625 [Azospirillum sp.]|nr:hypothetical protein [Azospirillum sp.]